MTYTEQSDIEAMADADYELLCWLVSESDRHAQLYAHQRGDRMAEAFHSINADMCKRAAERIDELKKAASPVHAELARVKAENERLREVVEWLAMNHEVRTQRNSDAVYWAGQFKVAHEKAKQALQQKGGE